MQLGGGLTGVALALRALWCIGGLSRTFLRKRRRFSALLAPINNSIACSSVNASRICCVMFLRFSAAGK